MRYNPSVSFADTSLYTREAFPLRRGFLSQSAQSADSPLLVEGAFPLRREWADEGIGPYKHTCKTYRHKKGPRGAFFVKSQISPGNSASIAASAAACSARFLLLPTPCPTALPFNSTSTSKCLS